MPRKIPSAIWCLLLLYNVPCTGNHHPHEVLVLEFIANTDFYIRQPPAQSQLQVLLNRWRTERTNVLPQNRCLVIAGTCLILPGFLLTRKPVAHLLWVKLGCQSSHYAGIFSRIGCRRGTNISSLYITATKMHVLVKLSGFKINLKTNPWPCLVKEFLG